MNWKIALAVILFLIVVIFTLQNTEIVEVDFFFWSFEASRAIVLFLTLLMGALIGWTISFIVHKE